MMWQALPRPIKANYFFKPAEEGGLEYQTLVFAFWAMCPERGLVYMTAAGHVLPATRLRAFEVLP